MSQDPNLEMQKAYAALSSQGLSSSHHHLLGIAYCFCNACREKIAATVECTHSEAGLQICLRYQGARL